MVALTPHPAQPPALDLVPAAPDAVVLVGLQGEPQAVVAHGAGRADGLGRLDLLDGGAGASRREEEAGVAVPTGRVLPPPVVVGVDDMGQHRPHHGHPIPEENAGEGAPGAGPSVGAASLRAPDFERGTLRAQGRQRS